MKSKKNRKNKYSKQDLDIKKVIVEETKDDKYPIIDRKATQAEIDLVKKVKNLLSKNAYNDNQIAAMLGIHAEKVKQIKDA